ncbi:hypothetical protein J7E24_07110 [Hymenobacter sp. ISL-91]|uniref:hypothetical protein n=1 Tax=Hymenobacter sp. ISL-91 TaxID=2819151 RepID=UPI001BED1CAC|nr:hypothetical protein [Hymenobacter sp. ISL-91]MBT2557549.1 hypothetical protein [Hymenobacter sp. ISL-91]
MKKLLLPLLLLAVAPAFAQLPALHAAPEKNDDTVVLTLPDEGRVAWQRAAGVLAARGYTFRYSDADLLTISTDYIELESYDIIGLFVRVEGNRLLLRGRWLVNSTDAGNGEAVSLGGFLSSSASKWAELEAVARELGGTAAYYNSAAR